MPLEDMVASLRQQTAGLRESVTRALDIIEMDNTGNASEFPQVQKIAVEGAARLCQRQQLSLLAQISTQLLWIQEMMVEDRLAELEKKTKTQ